MLLQFEIFIYFLSLIYTLYYLWDKWVMYVWSLREKKLQKIKLIQERIQKRQEKKTQVQSQAPSEVSGIFTETSKQAPVDQEKLREIIKRVQVNISRWYLDSARALIIEWLALSKNNKDLNLLLADIYEREKKYQNAEYIYRDVLDDHGSDEYTLQRLWNIYSLRGKADKAIECYTQALQDDPSNLSLLDILSHLSLEVKDHKKALKYAMLFLKHKPRDAEKLSIKGYCLECTGKYADAIKAYKSVLDLQPYNTEVTERIKKLESVGK